MLDIILLYRFHILGIEHVQYNSHWCYCVKETLNVPTKKSRSLLWKRKRGMTGLPVDLFPTWRRETGSYPSFSIMVPCRCSSVINDTIFSIIGIILK